MLRSKIRAITATNKLSFTLSYLMFTFMDLCLFSLAAVFLVPPVLWAWRLAWLYLAGPADSTRADDQLPPPSSPRCGATTRPCTIACAPCSGRITHITTCSS
jgi:hypothetical protein